MRSPFLIQSTGLRAPTYLRLKRKHEYSKINIFYFEQNIEVDVIYLYYLLFIIL